jgi:hypothetical protein
MMHQPSLQALTLRINETEAAARAQADAAAGEWKITREQHESEARAWSFERGALETQLGKQQQQAAAAAASASSALEAVKAQVCSAHPHTAGILSSSLHPSNLASLSLRSLQITCARSRRSSAPSAATRRSKLITSKASNRIRDIHYVTAPHVAIKHTIAISLCDARVQLPAASFRMCRSTSSATVSYAPVSFPAQCLPRISRGCFHFSSSFCSRKPHN